MDKIVIKYYNVCMSLYLDINNNEVLPTDKNIKKLYSRLQQIKTDEPDNEFLKVCIDRFLNKESYFPMDYLSLKLKVSIDDISILEKKRKNIRNSRWFDILKIGERCYQIRGTSIKFEVAKDDYNEVDKYRFDECNIILSFKAYGSAAISKTLELFYDIGSNNNSVSSIVMMDNHIVIKLSEDLSLGDWLRAKRNDTGLTQKELADKIFYMLDPKDSADITISSISNMISKYERGERSIPAQYRKAYALALNVDYESLEERCLNYKFEYVTQQPSDYETIDNLLGT